MICWPEARLKAAERLFELLHEDAPYHDGTFTYWSKKPTSATPFRYDDGTRFFMSPVELAPWDDWTTDPRASPFKPDDWDERTAAAESDDQAGSGI